MAATTIGLVAVLAACSSATRVDVESRSSTPAGTTPTTVRPESAPESPPSTEPTAVPDADPTPAAASVLFDLTDFDIEVTLWPTEAPAPPDGIDGFHTVAPLADGSLVASGFAAVAAGAPTERSALWRSADGVRWERIGVDGVAATPGLQTVESLVVADGVIRAYGNRQWESSDGGDNWVELPGIEGAVARNADLIDGRFVTVGAGDVDGLDGLHGIVTTEGAGQGLESRPVDVDGAGELLTGSDVHDLTVVGDEWLAVGSTTLTDPGRTGRESYADSETVGFPSDTAVWSSVDAGDSWDRLDIDRFAGEPGTQTAVQIADDGERRWMLVSAQKFGVFALDLYTSTDGRTWQLHPYRRPQDPVAGEVATARGVYSVESAIVVIDDLVSGSGPSLVMSVIDPATDEIVSHDLTDELGGVHQIEDIVQFEDLALGVGRIERGPTDSDLQTVEIRRIDPDAPEPVPSTTQPAGGGSSDA